MSAANASEVAVVPPSAATVVEAFGDRVTFHLTGRETGGKHTSFLVETAPGGGPPPHWHENEDEWFLVLEGQAEFFKDGVWTAVPAGSAVFAPRGSVHAFRNAGKTTLKQVLNTAPSGFETFFARIAEEFHREGGPDMARVVEISAEHGIHYA
jgi:quercetin dioxygenase-like cupin family protein